jgi:RNA exonuclease 4
LAFSEAHRSHQIGLRLQNERKAGLQHPKTPSAGSGPPKRTRRRRRQKKSPTDPMATATMSQQKQAANSSSGKKHHDAPMTKRDLYFCLRCGTVGIGPGGLDSAVGRVTLVNWENQVIIDTFVKVPVRVTDYRTAETGITAQALCSDKARKLEDVRAKVSAMIKGRILIGHGLEVDLSALGLMHPWCDVRDTAVHAPYMQEVNDPLTVMLLPRDLQGLAIDVLNRDISDSDGGPIVDAICCLDLYKVARSAWEADLIRLVQQKEKQRGMLISVRAMGRSGSVGNQLSAIKEDELDKAMAIDAKQFIPPDYRDQGGLCEYDECTIDSTEPTTTAGLESYRDDISEASEASSFYSTERWVDASRSTSSSVSSFFRFGKSKSQIENLSDVVVQGSRDSIWTPTRGRSSVASSSAVASEEDCWSRGDASTIGSSSQHGLWLPQSTGSTTKTTVNDWTKASAPPQTLPSHSEPTNVPLASLTEEELKEHLPLHLLNDLCDGEDEALDIPRSRRESSSCHPVGVSNWLQGDLPEQAPARQSSSASWFRSRQSKPLPLEDALTAANRRSEELSRNRASPSSPGMAQVLVNPDSRTFAGDTTATSLLQQQQQQVDRFATATIRVEPTLAPDEEWLQEIIHRRS